MPETRLERYLERTVDRATTPRGAAIVIACASLTITFASGFFMTILDRDNYATFGSGLWWAIQTVTTVGYGDNVPTTFAGRLLAALVMLFGIGILTVITAAITSTFVSRARVEQIQADSEPSTPAQADSEPLAVERLQRMEQRLERIEAAVTGRS